MWPTTQEDDLAEQHSARRLRLVLAVALMLSGLGVLVAVLTGLLAGGSGLSLLPIPLLIGTGLAVGRAGRSIHPTPDPSLPRAADLPDTDPRRALPLTERRAWWVLAVTLCLAGPAIGAAVVVATRATLPGLARLGLFLTLSYGAVFAGKAILTRRLASARWPAGG